MERAIRYAYIHQLENEIDSNNVFARQKEGYSFRNYISQNKFKLTCTECDQELCIAASSNKNLYFRHLPNSSNCILKRIDYSDEEQAEIREFQKSNESELHIHIKEKIAGYLLKKLKNVWLEKELHFEGEKRKPDILLFDNDGRRIAIEIQISRIPYSYIKERCDFYKKSGTYFLWIISNTQIYKQRAFELNIKYLTQYENIFEAKCINDEVFIFCHYKDLRLLNGVIVEKWVEKKVLFSELKFNDKTREVYYMNSIEGKGRAALIRRLANILKKTFDTYNYSSSNEAFENELLKLSDDKLDWIINNEEIIKKYKKVLFVLYSLKTNTIINFHFKTMQELIVYIFDHENTFVLLLFEYCNNKNIDLLGKSIDKNGTIRNKYNAHIPQKEDLKNKQYLNLFSNIVEMLIVANDYLF